MDFASFKKKVEEAKQEVFTEWDDIEEKKRFNPSKYRGIYKDLRFDLEGEIEKLRDEWNRE